jgi:hypothetical protein
MAAKTILLVVGALAEFGGILLIAAPDLIPGARRFGRWLDRRWRPIENRIRRALRLPGRSVTVSASAALSAAVAMSATAVVGVSETATLEEKVAFLLRRNEATQLQTAALAQRVDAIEKDVERREGELRDELHRHIATELRSALEADRVLRVVGSGLLALGLLLATVATLPLELGDRSAVARGSAETPLVSKPGASPRELGRDLTEAHRKLFPPLHEDRVGRVLLDPSTADRTRREDLGHGSRVLPRRIVQARPRAALARRDRFRG